MRMLRSMLNVTTRVKIRNRTLKEKIGTVDIGYVITKIKYKYAGHLARTNGTKWHKATTEWTPYEKRKRGRPAMRWRDEICRRVGTKWGEVAQNRERWKRVMDAAARNHEYLP